MPRKPIGAAAMSSTERVHRWRERHGLVGKTDRQQLLRARKEIEELRQQLAAASRQGPAKAAPEAKPTLSPSDAERLLKRVSELETALAAAKATKPAPVSDQAKELNVARHEIARLQHENDKLKAKIVKPVKVPLDPESEAVRQIEKLKKEKKALRQEADKWLIKLRTLVPTVVKNKVAKALREETTSRDIRHDALQAWNGLGLNNIGK